MAPINSARRQTVPSTQVKYRMQCLPDTNNCGEDGTDPHINQTFIHSQSCCQSLPATFHFHMYLAGKITQSFLYPPAVKGQTTQTMDATVSMPWMVHISKIGKCHIDLFHRRHLSVQADVKKQTNIRCCP